MGSLMSRTAGAAVSAPWSQRTAGSTGSPSAPCAQPHGSQRRHRRIAAARSWRAARSMALRPLTLDHPTAAVARASRSRARWFRSLETQRQAAALAPLGCHVLVPGCGEWVASCSCLRLVRYAVFPSWSARLRGTSCCPHRQATREQLRGKGAEPPRQPAFGTGLSRRGRGRGDVWQRSADTGPRQFETYP